MEQGKDPIQPLGTEAHPFHTYGGDTVLRIPPDPNDDRLMMSALQQDVAEIFFDADKYEAEDRVNFIARALELKYGENATKIS